MSNKKAITSASASSDFSALSMYKLRAKIGYLAIAFPFLIALNLYYFENQLCLDSISAYFHTSSKTIFIGVLAIIAFCFALTPKYPNSPQYNDDWVGIIAALSLVGLVYFPVPQVKSFTLTWHGFLYNAHYIFAGLFFCTLSFICLCLFVRSDKAANALTPLKRRQNFCYRLCGITIASCIATICIYKGLGFTFLDNLHIVTVLEAIAIFAFGFAWLVKSKSVWKLK